MKTKLVLWGTNAQDERVLIAMQLRAKDNKVDIWILPEAITTPEFAQKMLNEWRNDSTEVEFPEGTTHTEKELTVTESLLPEGLSVERVDIIQRAQTEWNFVVLSTKLHEAYQSELSEIGDKVGQLTDYSAEVWDSLKNFWNKVQEQVKERNLFREHADVLRDSTNALFDQMKQKRTSMANEFEENSKEIYSKFNEILDLIEQKVEKGIQNFPNIFEDLKKAQQDFKGQKLIREHSNEIWGRIDTLFKTVKEKKFGGNAIQDGSALERLTRRYEGLIGAIDKMQESIDRDKEELSFQNKRIATTQGQLEAQIRQAKINMINERVKSKEEKLGEMMHTKAEIETKMKSIKDKESKKAEEKVPVAKAEKKVEDTPSVESPKNEPSEMSEIAANASAAIDVVEKVIE